ncbi:hypothetical protein F5B17DRAFT_123882 [Nemania serpens]|nr:hypothetical protein F5B17DRAFT_123882 [Nemania serpens]
MEMRQQEIADATPKPSSAKRKASGSSPNHPLLNTTADPNVLRPLPNPSKRLASTIEVEDGIEYQHTYKRARIEGKAIAIEDGQVLGSDCGLDARRSVSPWPSIDEVQSQPEDSSEALRQRRLYAEVEEAAQRWEKQRDLQCEAYRRFRLQRLPSPAPSDADDDDFPCDSDADEFGCTPLMLGLDNDDPRVEEVFGLAYTQKLERRKLRKPSRRPTVPASPDEPFCIQHPLSSADEPNQGSTLKINDITSSREGSPSFKTPATITQPDRPSSSRITRQSLRRNTVFYELDHRAQAQVAKS